MKAELMLLAMALPLCGAAGLLLLATFFSEGGSEKT